MRTLVDVLAAAAHDVGLSDPGHCRHNAYGSECVHVMSRVLAALTPEDREDWETGRLLREVERRIAPDLTIGLNVTNDGIDGMAQLHRTLTSLLEKLEEPPSSWSHPLIPTREGHP